MWQDTQSAVSATEVRDHLRLLYGAAAAGGISGVLPVFTAADKRTRFVPAQQMLNAGSESIARLGLFMDTYVGLPVRTVFSGRGKASDTTGTFGQWFDIDIRGPAHKRQDLPTFEEAKRFLMDEIDMQPTLVVHTGHGLHVYWCYQQFVPFRSDEDRSIAALLNRRVQEGIIHRGRHHGWELDKTADLARVLRPSGTLNLKDPAEPRRVYTLYHSEARYQPADFVMRLCVRKAPPATDGAWLQLAPAGGSCSEVERRVRAYIEKVGPRTEGSRDNAARQLAVFIGNDMALPDDLVLAFLRAWNRHNLPPLDDDVIRDKARRCRTGAERAYGCARDK